MYNVTLWRDHLTTVAVETQQCILCVCCWATCHCQVYKILKYCTTTLKWQIYVAENNKTYLGLHVKCPMLH
jgi:hypothetical protein